MRKFKTGDKIKAIKSAKSFIEGQEFIVLSSPDIHDYYINESNNNTVHGTLLSIYEDKFILVTTLKEKVTKQLTSWGF